MPRLAFLAVGCAAVILSCLRGHAEILWSDPASRVIHAAPDGTDLLGGKLHRDNRASDALYFKFHVDPLSDVANEPYLALFQLVESNQFRLGVGNALEAWGYSAAYASETGPDNLATNEFNLRSAHPEAGGMGVFKQYELPNHNHDKTIVFKVQYVPNSDALVTVWLDPDLTHGATPENQAEKLTTKFKANACFDQIRLRHFGGGNGWIFSEMAVATSFNDFVIVHFWQTWWFGTLLALAVFGTAIASVRIVEKRKFQFALRHMAQQHALEQERARIAQDLHDELGSLLTRITLLGGLLQNDKNSPGQVEAHAAKIAHSADQTVRALEEIVWAVRPGSDTLQSLTDYIAHFATELFENDSLRCRLDLPAELPPRNLPPDVRHNLFLITKEALTNVLKHSAAREVRLQLHLQAEPETIVITVTDDGRGFDPALESAGQRNGLGNMRRRAEAIRADLRITSQDGRGTEVAVAYRFPK